MLEYVLRCVDTRGKFEVRQVESERMPRSTDTFRTHEAGLRKCPRPERTHLSTAEPCLPVSIRGRIRVDSELPLF
jgi:hypothetical protein